MREIAPLVRRPIETAPDQFYPEVGIRSFGRGVFHKEPKTGLELGEKRLFEWKLGDLLFNIVFAWEGAVAVASQEEDGKVGSHRFLTCTAKVETDCYRPLPEVLDGIVRLALKSWRQLKFPFRP
jgi:type I restriction enzyme S subunit